ncbi:MAG TPA: hypothetical protein VGO11_27870 [Chthoniobacteraceae bacterium]|jgi:hypothetical protein|nr:hypothetical protein [Chthoniobacteraceae bacterium]
MTFILNLAIGLIFVFLVFSLVVTAANELLVSWLQQREKSLREGIGELLHDRNFVTKACDLYAHPLIGALSRKKDGQPSYIPKGTFVTALLDLLVPANTESPRTIDEIKLAIARLIPNGVAAIKANIAAWNGTNAQQFQADLDDLEGADAKKEKLLSELHDLTGEQTESAEFLKNREFLAAKNPAVVAKWVTHLAFVKAGSNANAQAAADAVDTARLAATVDPVALKTGLQTLVTSWDADLKAKRAQINNLGPQTAAARKRLSDFVHATVGTPQAFLKTWLPYVGLVPMLAGLGMLSLAPDSPAMGWFGLALTAIGGILTGIFGWKRLKGPAAPVTAGSALPVALEIQAYLSADKLRATFTALLDEAKYDLETFKTRLGDWFDNSMLRVTGWYKARTQLYLFLLGLAFAAFANVDSLHIMRYLAKDPTVAKSFADAIVQTTASARTQQEALKTAEADLKTKQEAAQKSTATDADRAAVAVAQKARDDAEKLAKASLAAIPAAATPTAGDDLQSIAASADNQIKQTFANLGGASIPIGWGATERRYFLAERAKEEMTEEHSPLSKWIVEKLLPDKTPPSDFAKYRLDRSHALTAILGFLLTALAGSMGAPFWFDNLNKIITIRSSGKKPEEEASRKKKEDAAQ